MEKKLIRVNLRLPVLKMGIGGLTIDPVEKAVGRPIADILRPRLVGEPREEKVGKKWSVVYPMGFADGDGAALPLGPLGEVSFQGDGGLLRVAVPAQFGAQVAEHIRADLVRGPEEGWSSSGKGRVQFLWVRPRPGLCVKQSLNALGEISIEVVG